MAELDVDGILKMVEESSSDREVFMALKSLEEIEKLL